MAKVTKKAFEHFKGVYEMECGWTVDNETMEALNQEWQKMKNTMWRIKFAYTCLYEGEKPLSKKDYGRVRFTERTIQQKMDSICHVYTHDEVNAFNRKIRRWQIEKGLYPFKTGGKSFNELIEEHEELRIYYEEGRYKRGSFVDKYIAHIHRF